MSKLSLILVSLTFSVLAQATSMHPCTPTVRAMDIRISCKTETGYARIIISTLMSPAIAMCQGSQHYEYQTAHIQQTDGSGRVIGKAVLQNGTFSFTLSPTGAATFNSRNARLDYRKCVTPLHGGFSVGN